MIKLLDYVNARSSGSSISNEAHTVGEDDANWVYLLEVPETAAGVTISGYTRVDVAPAAGEFRVYVTGTLAGAVEFHSSNNGASVSVSYTGMGSAIFARDPNRIKAWLRKGVGYHIEEFGGLADGSTVNDQAIIDAYTAMDDGDTLLFDDGTYVVDNVDLGALAKKGIKWVGKGVGRTILKKATGGTFGSTNVEHLFRDISSTGGTDGLEVENIEFDLSRASATSGHTVSAFFFARVNGLHFRRCKFRDGIEEGLKLYKCQDVYVDFCTFDNIRNNGIQCHCPSADGYTGGRANQGFKNVHVRHCHFEDIDDGAGGTLDGEAVTFNSTDATVECHTGIVAHCTIDNCIRGPWCEVNTASAIIRNIVYIDCYITNSVSHGAAIIGCESSAIIGCRAHNCGDATSLSSETFAFYMGGSASRKGKYNQMVDCSAIDDRGTAYMDYGFRVQQVEHCEMVNCRSRGATTKNFWLSSSTITNLVMDVRSPMPLASVRISAETITTGATGVNVEWNGADALDPLAMHDPSTNPERLVPAWEGSWKCRANVTFVANATGYRRARIVKKDPGGETVVALAGPLPGHASEETGLYLESPWVTMDSDDYFIVNAWQDSGGNLDLYATTSWAELEFCGVVNPA